MDKKEEMPKNKEQFKRLVKFAKEIIQLCKDNDIPVLFYGSFIHFYYTRDKTMNVNDIDLMVIKKDFPRLMSLLKKNKIEFKFYPDWKMIIIKKGALKIEIDYVNEEYKKGNKLNERILEKIDFYGVSVFGLTLKQLEEMYALAYNRSMEDKDRIMDKIKRLEKFLGRRVKNNISVDIVKNKDLTRKQKEIINKSRVKEFGKDEKKDFSKDYEPNTLWFFVKYKKKVVSLGGLRPVKIKYNNKLYNILGICSIVSLIKKKGYGKFLMSFMIDYSRRTGKTLLGFTGQTKFFGKVGLGTKKDFIKRFVYIKPSGEKVYDRDGDGIYYEGKNKIISKILKGKNPVYIFVLHW